VSKVRGGGRKAIPLGGIVLVLGILCAAPAAVYSGGAASPNSAHPEANSAPARGELITLIQEFLKNVPNNERSTFDGFFADDLIYTRATGQLITKKDILADTGNKIAPRAGATYTGEDFTVHRYGEMAVVNFRLVMHASENDQAVTHMFRNTGTFIERSGRWQVVAWQATPIVEQK
jgi:hypothetical protein